MLLPRSLAHLKREILEKGAEARQWAVFRASRKKYKMPSKQKSDASRR